MEKDADAYRTISEVAEALGIPPHVLRFWETKFPQVKPLKRGGGRRYYRRSDADLLRTIRRLLYEDGYTIRGVQRLLRAKGAAGLAALPPEALPPPEELDGGEHTAGGESVLPTPDEHRGPLVAQLVEEIAICRALLQEALCNGPGASAGEPAPSP
jgi:DNA-binding transcriptional MerR regulator